MKQQQSTVLGVLFQTHSQLQHTEQQNKRVRQNISTSAFSRMLLLWVHKLHNRTLTSRMTIAVRWRDEDASTLSRCHTSWLSATAVTLLTISKTATTSCLTW